MFDRWKSQLIELLKHAFTKQYSLPHAWKAIGPRWVVSSLWPCDSVESMQYSLLSLLSVAHSERLDPKPLIRALASEHRGRYRRRLNLLARRLDGSTLVQALEKTPDALSDDVVLAIRFGSQSGTLSSTFAQLVETEKPQVDVLLATQRNAKGYLVGIAVGIFVLLPFLMFFIAPTLRMLWEEYGRPPEIAWSLLQVCWELLIEYFLLVCGLCIALAWLVWSSASQRFFRCHVANRFFRPNAMSRSANLFRMLSIAVETGRPLAGSLSTLAKYHFDPSIRRRLLLARNEVEQGVAVWSSLVDAKIISPEEFQVISSSDNSRVQSWMLCRMALVKLERARQSVLMRSAFLHPMAILIFAALVLWVCYSFFRFIMMLVTSLAG